MKFKTYSGNNIHRKADSSYFDMWDTFLFLSYRFPDSKEKYSRLSEYFNEQRLLFPQQFCNGMFRDEFSQETVLADLQLGIDEINLSGCSLDLVPILERVQQDIKKVPFQAVGEA